MTHIAVLGAGNVGCALAADLTRRGFDVRVFNRSAARLDPIREAGGITLTGVLDGFAEIRHLSVDLRETVRGAEVVVVALPTVSLPCYAEALAAATTDDQVIWLNPGHTGGALFLAREIRRRFPGRRPKICQLSTASHISRMTGPAAVGVFALPAAGLAALPAPSLDECHERIDALLPGRFTRLATVLEADLGNLNALLHPPGMVCAGAWIEATSGDFRFYADGLTPAVARVLDAVDGERLALATRLGVPAAPFTELFRLAGFTGRHDNTFDAIRQSAPIQAINAPPTLNHRYLDEDVGWGLVPWLHLARTAGTPAPNIAALVRMASILNGVDYATTGLTLERMGLESMTLEEIRGYVDGRSPVGAASR
jgi:opine dehydrogenase